jgi:hypothetical protein
VVDHSSSITAPNLAAPRALATPANTTVTMILRKHAGFIHPSRTALCRPVPRDVGPPVTVLRRRGRGVKASPDPPSSGGSAENHHAGRVLCEAGSFAAGGLSPGSPAAGPGEAISHRQVCQTVTHQVEPANGSVRRCVLRRVMRDTRPPTHLRQSKARIAAT